MECRDIQAQKKQSSDCLFRLKIGAKEGTRTLTPCGTNT